MRRNFLFLTMAFPLAIISIPDQVVAQDAVAGKQVFARCSMCHAIAPGKNGIGPSLAGVFGRKAGSERGFAYSKAMSATKQVWNKATLDAYLLKPQAAVPGNKMPYAGLPGAADRQNLIAYLVSLK